MLKTIKKVVLGSLSILMISFLVWTVALLNPSMAYSKSTIVENVTIYHNSILQPETKAIVINALNTIKTSEIYNDQSKIELCLNDGSFYPSLHPFASGTAYAFLNKVALYHCQPDFKANTASFQWELNNNELRKFDLTVLLAHEFMHTAQHEHNSSYYNFSTLGKLNWKFEGHADYIARQYKQDGALTDKIDKYLFEAQKEHVGIPVFTLEDGTIQNLAYFKYAIVIQYLMEVKELSFDQICKLDIEFDQLFKEMLNWNKQ